jgi:prepilin-type N-terminal cleavage/methylation domain-containing protein
MNSRRDQRGFSLLEGIVVLVLVGLTAAVASSLVKERVLSARVRVAASQLAFDLRAARLKAVSNRTAVNVTFTVDPANRYEYTDTYGRLRTRNLAAGVRIVSSSSPIVFQSNGSVSGGASTLLEANVSSSAVERWTIDTTVLGNPRVTHERVTP